MTYSSLTKCQQIPEKTNRYVVCISTFLKNPNIPSLSVAGAAPPFFRRFTFIQILLEDNDGVRNGISVLSACLRDFTVVREINFKEIKKQRNQRKLHVDNLNSPSSLLIYY